MHASACNIIFISSTYLHVLYFSVSKHDLSLLENFMLGGEEGRTSGWVAADASRRRVSAPVVGSLLKQTNPVGNDSSSNKEAVVST